MLFQQQAGFVDVYAEYLVRNYTVEDGLPVNAISDIVQDEDGYLYFATYNGLVRYDGYEFRTFNSSNSRGLESDRIVGMAMDPTNTIWLIDETAKVISYKDGSFKTYAESDGVTGSAEYIEISEDGDVWVVTSKGLLKFNPNQNSFEQQSELNKNESIWRVSPLGNGKLLGVSEKGLFKWDGNKTKTLLPIEDFPTGKSVINFITKLSNGDIWMASNGAFSFNENTLKVTTYDIPDKTYSQTWSVVKVDSQFIISTTNGFFAINGDEIKAKKLSVDVNPLLNRPKAIQEYDENVILFGNQVIINDQVIFESQDVKTGFIDREGSIWVASESNGLFQLRKSIVTNITSSDNSAIKNIYSIVQDREGDIWAGSFENGIIRISEKEKTNYTVDNSNLGSNIVRFLYEDEKGIIYAGLWGGGLWKFSNNDWRKLEFPDNLTIEAMHQSANGVIYIGSKNGSYINQKGLFVEFEEVIGEPFNAVRVIRESHNETLFFGTNGNGLGILDGDKSFHILTNLEGVVSNLIRDIYVVSPDTLWLATENRGLNRIVLNNAKQIIESIQIDTEDGLISSSLHRIIDDKRGSFWISSNQGVMQISKRALNNYTNGNSDYLSVTKYNQRDGMVNQEANGGVQTAGILAEDGSIWFPNQQGITVFNDLADDVADVDYQINPIIEQINLSDSVLDIRKRAVISFPKGERNFGVKFTAPNFAFPERLIFKYKLSGISEEWRVLNKVREINFTNLKPGRHTLEVQTETYDGRISSASLTIIVPSFFYETMYFKFIVGLCFIGLGFGVYQYRVHTLRERERELQQRVAEQTQKLEQAAEEKSRFFTGITHELKTPLSLMLGPLDELSENTNAQSISKFQAYTQMMHRNGYRLKNLIDQILDVSKLNADAIKLKIHPFDIVKLTKQIAGQFQSLLHQKGIALDIHSDSVVDDIYLDKEAWERIIINLISNAIKFSPESGRIVLSIVDFEKNVKISVRDYGEGISLKDQQKVFEYLYQVTENKVAEGTGIGLYLVKGLIERMGGEITVQSKRGNGAEFIVSLKKGSSHFSTKDLVFHTKVELEKNKKKVSKIEEVGKNDRPKVKKVFPTKILIVEDNADFRDYMSSILSKEYNVTVAENGKEGLSLVNKVSPDIVISDVMMPVMDGYEFVNKLREIEKFKQTPVMFLSAKDQEVDMQMGLSTGADIYLTKPIRSSTLLSQIKAVLRREEILNQKREQSNVESTSDSKLETQLHSIIYRQLGNPNLNVNLLAESLYMSRSKLYREWKKVSDISIKDLINKIRFEEAIVLIKEKEFSIQDAAKAVGFSDPNYFSTSFKKKFGYSPSEINNH